MLAILLIAALAVVAIVLLANQAGGQHYTDINAGNAADQAAQLMQYVQHHGVALNTLAPASSPPSSPRAPSAIAARMPPISAAMKVRLCRVSSRLAVSSPARTR